MRNVTIIFLLFLSNLIFSQEKFDNEKQIENIENYNVEEINAKIDDTVTIFGTLVTPKSDFDKILVIISGTGKISQKAHNYLTEFLLENNIGVFRFDKRGVGKSTGKYNDQPKVYTSDFIEIYKQFKKSKSISNKKIGFLGHSLGGIVSIQATEKNFKPNFLIQWSAPTGKPRDLLKFQIENGIKNYDKLIVGQTINERIRAIEYIYGLIDKNPNKKAFELWKIAKKESKKVGIKKNSFENYLMPNNVEFARIDNTEAYKEIDFPTLVIIGENYILADPNQIEKELIEIGNPNYTFKKLVELNHFMTKKGTNQKTNEIYNIDLSFKTYLVDWIKELK